jgi:hypothetical protein
VTTVTDPLDAMQAGIRAVLLADAGLVALVGQRVYDEPPEDVPFPYVHIGESTSIPDGTHDSPGYQVAATLHSWAKARSMRPVNEIGARLVAALNLQEAAVDAAVTGLTVWRVWHEFAQTLRDPDRTIRHRIDRFRFFVHQ